MDKGFEIRPLENIGAEVCGLNIETLSEDQSVALYNLWLQFGVLVFKHIGTSIDLHLKLSRVFGPLERHPVESLLVEDNPDLIFLGGDGFNKGPKFIVDGEVLAGFIYYHQDTSYTPDICKGSMLRMIAVPDCGGDTIWVDTAKAYNGLPHHLRAAVDGLSTVQGCNSVPDRPWGRPGMEIEQVPDTANAGGDAPAMNMDLAGIDMRFVVHPMVSLHPEAGFKSLLLSPLGFVEVCGMNKEEGDALYEEVMRHVLRPEYQYRHEWSENDLVLWDSRRTMHHAVGYDYDDTRLVYRTTLGGAQRTGRYIEEPEGNSVEA